MRRIEVLVFSVAAVFITISAFGAAIDNMKPVLENVKAELSDELSDIDEDLSEAAKKLGSIDFKSADAREILAEIGESRSYAYTCSIIDPGGKLIVVEPSGSKEYEGRDISFEPAVKKILETKQSVLSGVFKCLDGTNKIDFEYPIINKKGKFIGAISLLVSHEVLLTEMIAPIVKNKPCKIWVMQTDGLVIYDPDPNQVNKNIFTDPMFAPSESLIAFSKKAATAPNGTGSYDFYKKGYEDKTIVTKDAIWDTAGLHGTEWRLIAMEIEASANSQEQAAKKEMKTLEGEIVTMDTVASTIDVKWLENAAEEAYDQSTFLVSRQAQITNGIDNVALGDLDMGDRVVIEYYKDSFGALVAEKITVKEE